MVYPPGIVNFRVRESRFGGPDDPDHLHFVSNGFFPSPILDAAAVDTYKLSQTRAGTYTGPAARRTQLARTDVDGNGDRGHCLCVVPDHYLITTTERTGEDNFGESLYVVPASYSGEVPSALVRRLRFQDVWGLSPPKPPSVRLVARMADDTVIFGAANFVRVPLDALLDFQSDLSSYPRWYNNETQPATGGFDCVPDPRNPDWLWVENDDKFFAYDFSQPEGLLTRVRVASGSNIGLTGWGGGLAFGPDNYLWKPLMHLNQLGAWSPAQQDALPLTEGGLNGNPVPARTLGSPAFDAFDHNSEQGLFRIAFDPTGAWVSTYQYANDPTDPALAFHFSLAQMAAGGTQTPDAIVHVAISHPLGMRVAGMER